MGDYVKSRHKCPIYRRTMAIHQMSDATSWATMSMNEQSGSIRNLNSCTHMNLRAEGHLPPPPRSPFSSRKFHTSQPLFDISFSSRQYSLLSGRVSPVGLSEMGNTTGGTPDASMGDPTVAETVQGRVE